MINTQKCITSPKAKKDYKPRNDLISIILLCDSPGYRMKSYGPTSLITIANNRLIDIQIDAISKAFKFYEIILCVGFDAEKISKYVRNKYSNINIRIVENQLYNDSNSCESARLALNNTINDQILICDGNLLINSETLSLINDSASTVIIESDPCVNLEVGVNLDEKNEAQHFSFGASNIWSEIVYLDNQEIIETLRRIICGTDYKSKFMFEALNELIKTKHKLKCVKNEHSIKKINNVKTYHAITR
jgi:NDP-sugar pyrophosphorylase family protein